MKLLKSIAGATSRICQAVAIGCLSVAALAQTPVEPAYFAEPRQLEAEGFGEIFAQIAPGVYIAGQPSEAGLKRAQSLGVKRVINLRTQMEMDDREVVPYDEAAAAKALGLDYVHIPAGGPDTPYSPEQLNRFAQALEGADGVLLHCTVAFRATHMWTAYLIDKQGVPYAEAIDVARQLNLGRMPMEGFLGRTLTIEPKQ